MPFKRSCHHCGESFDLIDHVLTAGVSVSNCVLPVPAVLVGAETENLVDSRWLALSMTSVLATILINVVFMDRQNVQP